MTKLKHFIEKDFTFEAAHKLERQVTPSGKCKRLHGHSYKMTLKFARKDGGVDRELQMVRDFDDIKDLVAILYSSRLDHHYLNETWKHEQVTAEWLAQAVFEWLSLQITISATLDPSWHSIMIYGVTIQETCTGRAYYGHSCYGH